MYLNNVIRRSIFIAVCTLPSVSTAAEESVAPADIIFDSPHTFPAGAGISKLTFRAVGEDGSMLTTWSGTVSLSGLAIRTGNAAANSELRPFAGEVTFKSGLLQVTPALLGVRQIRVSPHGISVTANKQHWHFPVHVRPSWLRLLPPILAIGLVVLFRDVTVSLVLAIFGGCLLFFPLTESYLAVPVFCETMVRTIADYDHASVILFTLLLGAMIGLMNDSGGTRTAIESMSGLASTRRRGMFLTWLMGFLVFFDDYANSMLIGGAMRPLSDKLRFSRAKLAFLIDSTSAPVAGLAISTWTAFEIDQVVAGFEAAGVEANAADFFWSTIPFRIYPILMICVVAVVACSGRDFGPMLRTEQNQPSVQSSSQTSKTHGSIWLAVIPVFSLVIITVTGFRQGIDAYRLLLIASFVSSTLAIVLSLSFSQMSLDDCIRSWISGISSMIPAVVILVLAWGVSAVCDTGQLNTAGYIIAMIGNSVRPEFLPAIAFLAAGAIATAIGSSFTTMALLLPILIPLTCDLMGSTNAVILNDPVFGSTIGAVLAGAIFGDHCSPISDTTVLSSAAAGCEHLLHVTTQLPYALLTAITSVLLGYLPIGFGIPWWICLPVAIAVCIGGILFLGKESDS
ncbi:MAG: hypothetical protein MK102_05160 [Fuerstiella sp.]|nr:hypothetical protein [Fuerstiella sp.]